MADWLIPAAGIAGFVAVIIFIVWFSDSIVEAIFTHKEHQRFEKEMREAIEHSQPSWSQLLEIARTRSVSQRSTYLITLRLLREILTGHATALQPHRALVEGYIAKYKEAEPFEGLPSETRIHLERLRENLVGKEALLDPLTTQIKELVSVYEKDKNRQRAYTVWGFIIGIVGFFFAAYAYFYPYVPPK